MCRVSTGVCDPAELCNGTNTCPGNTFLPAGTVCRLSAGVCDVAEVCSGSSGPCPAEGFVAAGTVCRAAVAGGCDVQEVCTGGGPACPADVVVAAGTLCRASVGACDPAETCTGGNSCPGNTLLGAGTVCRASVGACDVAEVCNGGVGTCPADSVVAAGTVCRGSAGACDPAESCNGSSGLCPGNTLTAGGTICRSAAGICDVAEACTGSSAACPGDSFVAAGTVCRASANQPYCDPAETCTGAMAACPGNTVIRAPTTEVCDSIDNDCNGQTDEGASTTCGTAINLGTLGVGGTFTRTEYIAAPAGSEQWYVVSLPLSADVNSHGTGTPQITLTGSPSLRFEVQSSCGANLPCGSGGTATGLNYWAFADTVSPPGAGAYASRAVTWPTTLFIRVYRVSATTTCANQTLTISRPAGSAYQWGFTQGVTPLGTPACTNWNLFRAGIDPARTYNSVTLSGSNNPVGRTCTGAGANTICQALRTGVTTSVACGGNTWIVGQCGGGSGNVEISADGQYCTCASTFVARPCHGDANFGGLGGGSCGQAYQTLQVNCQ